MSYKPYEIAIHVLDGALIAYEAMNKMNPGMIQNWEIDDVINARILLIREQVAIESRKNAE